MLDAGEISISDQLHTDRIFTSGFGGATRLDIKGYTISGRIQAYIPKSGNAPHTFSANLPARYARPTFKIWTGGFYAEGTGLILNREASVKAGQLATLDLSFESDGMWSVFPNAVERWY